MTRSSSMVIEVTCCGTPCMSRGVLSWAWAFCCSVFLRTVKVSKLMCVIHSRGLMKCTHQGLSLSTLTCSTCYRWAQLMLQEIKGEFNWPYSGIRIYRINSKNHIFWLPLNVKSRYQVDIKIIKMVETFQWSKHLWLKRFIPNFCVFVFWNMIN